MRLAPWNEMHSRAGLISEDPTSSPGSRVSSVQSMVLNLTALFHPDVFLSFIGVLGPGYHKYKKGKGRHLRATSSGIAR